MRRTPVFLTALLVAAALLSGCNESQVAQNGARTPSEKRAAGMSLPSGTSVDVTLATALTSETASVGDPWTGSTRSALTIDGQNAIPAGSSVAGTVTSVRPAHKGDRAMLGLGLTSITVDGYDYHVRGTMESVVAGSTRARNLGAIGAATAAVLKDGTPLTFTTSQSLAVRL
jgi:hypothetical protein